jgi:hypothetical protein
MKKLFAIIAPAFLAASVFAVNVTQLRCEYGKDPLGVDVPHPRLSWILESNRRDARQTAYQVLVASSAAGLKTGKADLWDSGKVASDQSILLPYAGEPLASHVQCFCKVRVWDEHGQVSKWSQSATWTMGVLTDSDWRASWITAPDTNYASTLLRREFFVRPGLQRALADICGLGQYEMSLNGRKAGGDFLSPGWTKYDKTCLYDTRDITADLKGGKNAVGIFLGNGMYNVIAADTRYTKFKGSFGPQKVILQIRLEYAGGLVEVIGTDEKWRVAPGPITFSSIYGGEDFDARLVQRGWDKPNFDDSKWPSAQITDGPGGKLKGLSCAAPPIREFEIHKPAAMRTLDNQDVVFDLGQNAAHVPRIRVTGPAGGRVRLFPAELTNHDGSVNQGSMGVRRQNGIWCQFTKAANGEEIWSPKFFYAGCRYVQAHLMPAVPGGERPKIKSLAGIVVHSASEPVGEFECSSALLNRIHTLVRWAQRANMMSLMTDCPHRERMGWLEEDHLNGPALRYEFDLAQLFAKTVNDIADSQLPNGLVPTTAPEYQIFRDARDKQHLRGIFGDSPEWSSSFILVPWQQYEFDGDLDLFRNHYNEMKQYLDYLGSRANNCIVNYGLGDWYDIGQRHPGVSQLTPIALTATAFYYQDVKIMSRAAALLGKNDDAKTYSALAEKTRAAFNEAFYNPANPGYATGSQCANSIPLVMGLCDPANRAAVLDAVVRDVQARGNALTAGDVGYRYLLRALAEGGRSDVIFAMNNQSNKPGYGWQLKEGATSLTEAWDAGRDSSQDHFMLGQIQEWFYHDLAGIQNAPGSAGFREIVIAPQPVGGLKWAGAAFHSVRGKIASRWKSDGKKFNLTVLIPANTTATICVPAGPGSRVRVNGASAKFLRNEDSRAIFAVGSGEYEFQSQF